MPVYPKAEQCPHCGHIRGMNEAPITLPLPGFAVVWGFIDPETGEFLSVSEDGMRTRWGAPTPEELDDVCAAISASGYASEAVAALEDWTLRRWGVTSAFTKALHEGADHADA